METGCVEERGGEGTSCDESVFHCFECPNSSMRRSLPFSHRCIELTYVCAQPDSHRPVADAPDPSQRGGERRGPTLGPRSCTSGPGITVGSRFAVLASVRAAACSGRLLRLHESLRRHIPMTARRRRQCLRSPKRKNWTLHPAACRVPCHQEQESPPVPLIVLPNKNNSARAGDPALLPYPSFGLSVFFLSSKSLCGGGVPSSHPSLCLFSFFLSTTPRKEFYNKTPSHDTRHGPVSFEHLSTG